MAEHRGRSVTAVSSESARLHAISARLVGLRYPWWRLAIGGLVLAATAVFAASQGSVDIPFGSVVGVVLARLPWFEMPSDAKPAWNTILWELRLPRVVLAAIVGGALAMSGAAYQGLFKNPLADPYLVGVASGAGLGATIVLLTGVPLFLGGFSLLASGRVRGRNFGSGDRVLDCAELAGYTADDADLGGGRDLRTRRSGDQPLDDQE